MGEPAVTRLAKLHKRLARLRRRRRRVRWGTAYAAAAVALVWLAAAAFLADWSLELNRPQRVVAMAVCLGALVWAVRRYVRPWLGQRETELDMALLVQQEQRIDSDLVAAIQFESPEAPEWGSIELEEEVIDRTARLGDRLNVMQGFSRKPLARRTAVLAISGAALAFGLWQFPDYATTFLARFFLLGSQHYPTRTVIESVAVNGRLVAISGWRPAAVRCAYGEPVRFEVTCSGQLPHAGRTDLKTERGGQTSVPLDPAEGRFGVYAGELARLVDSIEYQIYLGDAWTDPARLEVVPLPTIDVELEVTPPSYAAEAGPATPTSTRLRQISVIEGSRVQIRITSDKPLEEATLLVDGEEHRMVRDETPAEATPAGTDRWTLDPGGTPLARVVEPIRYEVRAVDMDDLEPERTIQGVVRIKADFGPRITASAVTDFVLPTARPGISYDASDDYGLARLLILPEVTHDDGRVDQLGEIVVYKLPEGESPQKEARDRYALDLGPLDLVKGDQLSVTVQAVDYRGPGREGKATQTEPLVFHVTDERGILAAMAEADRDSAERLKTMIQRQIEVGERE